MNYIVKAQARDMSPVAKTAKTFPNAYLEARMLLSEGEDYVAISEQASGAVVWDSKSLDMYGDFEHYMELLEEAEQSMARLSLAMSAESFWID